jgi:nucleoside-diphosphate-sugar epimerase
MITRRWRATFGLADHHNKATNMRIFLTGANGFIGGAVASALIADGHAVRGLVRDQAKADAVAAHGIEAVIGSLDDAALLQAEARASEGVVNAANSGHRAAVEALIAGLACSNKPFIHTSGSSIVADKAMGEPSDRVFHEDTPIEPEAERVARVAIDRLVLGAPGIRPVVLCNTMIYGHAIGVPAQSVQIPALVQQARASGVARYIGRGLNRWSNVHIADVAALYALAVARAPAGSFMYVESGEEALGEVVRAIAARLDLGAAQSWPAEQAFAVWGREKATFSLGSNSRVRGKAATEHLCWTPRHRSITDWIARELV